MDKLVKKLKSEVSLKEGLDLEYTGREEAGSLNTKITIPVKAIIMKSTYINRATGEEAPEDLGSYEIKYDTKLMNEAIEKALIPIIEKAIKDKVAKPGGDVLLGFMNSFYNEAYAKDVAGGVEQASKMKRKIQNKIDRCEKRLARQMARKVKQRQAKEHLREALKLLEY